MEIISKNTSNKGKDAEDWVELDLTRRGYSILIRNLRFKMGEIDIIAHDASRKLLWMVEVRSHWDRESFWPELSFRKQRHLSLATRAALEHPQIRLYKKCELCQGLAWVCWNSNTKISPKIEWYEFPIQN